ncbi:MAG: hypothetical protein ACXIUV_11300 [Alkalilacustris sp.]
MGRVEALGAAITLVWLALAGALFLGGGVREGGWTQILAVLMGLLPVALVWMTVAMLRVTRAMRAEAARLHAALEDLRQDVWDGAPPPASQSSGRSAIPEIERRLEALLAAQSRVEAALARALAQDLRVKSVPAAPVAPPAQGLAEAPGAWAGREAAAPAGRPALAQADAPTPPPAEAQPVLALDAPDGADPAVPAPVTVADFLRALNFPDTVEDRAGFAALRAGLADPRSARVIRAAQDVLTLLSEDGIYMDDLMPPPRIPEADLWRRFARGERGRAVEGLGGVDDPASLERTAARMREDAVFRDVAHHFLRHFDRMIEALEPNVTDADLARLAETRSARAFMLLGRVSGSFG